MATIIGDNVKIFDKEDCILIKIMKDGDLTPSKTGNSQILASSKGFATITDISGKELSKYDVGLNLVLTLRKKKVKAEEKPASTKKKTKRLDDDD